MADFGRCGGVVDYAAVDGEAGVGDEDLDVGWEAMYFFQQKVLVGGKLVGGRRRTYKVRCRWVWSIWRAIAQKTCLLTFVF